MYNQIIEAMGFYVDKFSGVSEILQPAEISEKLKSKKIFDKYGWTGEYSVSVKEIIDLVIDSFRKTD